MSIRIVYFHEDDYCQIEILPAQNWQHCASELGIIEEFSEKHRATEGLGWTAAYARQEEPTSLATLRLDATKVVQAIRVTLGEFDRVETGYGSHKEECVRTRAFGFNGECVMFVYANEDGIADRVWLGLDGPPESERSALLSALASLGKLSDLLLVDWGWRRLFLLSDAAAIAGYLSERELRMRQIREEIENKRKTLVLKSRSPWWKLWG